MAAVFNSEEVGPHQDVFSSELWSRYMKRALDKQRSIHKILRRNDAIQTIAEQPFFDANLEQIVLSSVKIYESSIAA